MPFKSKQQSKACFATKGFGGKVNCKEWADKTNYKKLPSRSKTSSKKMDGIYEGCVAMTANMIIDEPFVKINKLDIKSICVQA